VVIGLTEYGIAEHCLACPVYLYAVKLVVDYLANASSTALIT
jgi:hypothetical protein